MIDFQNASYVKLGEIPIAEVASQIDPLLMDDEKAYAAFKGMRDYIVFTSKRIIAVNVQGITGKKKDYTSLPFSKVQAFSLETAGTFDLDAELELWFSGLGKVKFEFKGKTDVAYLNKLVAHYVL
jgi:hypothetical protein